MDQQRVIRDVAVRLPVATTVRAACQGAVNALGEYAPATISVLLQVSDRLRCIAATGSWQVFSTVPPKSGIVGRVHASGLPAVVPSVAADPDYLPIRPDVRSEICVPILSAGRPIGVLDLQWNEPADLEQWRDVAERIAGLLGSRIAMLGGPPAESRSEKLLRHAAAFAAAPTERDLTVAALVAARDVSGLDVAVLIATRPDGPQLNRRTGTPSPLETRVRAELDSAGPAPLRQLISHAHRYGASYTLGEPGHPAVGAHRPLIDAGVRTLVAVPFGTPESGGVLLVADEELIRPDPTTVNLMELLAAQAWTCLDRLRTLIRLREQASSDPLTGLPHTGPFGRRMRRTTPGRTALLAIDVDNFKEVNDTFGHQAGDRVLVGLARALEGALRAGDELYRTGGDEFVAVIDVARADEAVRIAERLVGAARQTGRTISVGVALADGDESPQETLRRADEALYTVKRNGRDGVALTPATPDAPLPRQRAAGDDQEPGAKEPGGDNHPAGDKEPVSGG